jgi:hypothetical protein
LISVLDKRELSASRPCRFTSRKRALGTHCGELDHGIYVKTMKMDVLAATLVCLKKAHRRLARTYSIHLQDRKTKQSKQQDE